MIFITETKKEHRWIKRDTVNELTVQPKYFDFLVPLVTIVIPVENNANIDVNVGFYIFFY